MPPASTRPAGGPLRDRPVAQKLFASFGVPFLLVLAVAGTGMYELRRSADAAVETTGAAADTASAARELAQVADRLQQSLAMFRY